MERRLRGAQCRGEVPCGGIPNKEDRRKKGDSLVRTGERVGASVKGYSPGS